MSLMSFPEKRNLLSSTFRSDPAQPLRTDTNPKYDRSDAEYFRDLPPVSAAPFPYFEWTLHKLGQEFSVVAVAKNGSNATINVYGRNGDDPSNKVLIDTIQLAGKQAYKVYVEPWAVVGVEVTASDAPIDSISVNFSR